MRRACSSGEDVDDVCGGKSWSQGVYREVEGAAETDREDTSQDTGHVGGAVVYCNGNGKLEWECFFNEQSPSRPFMMTSNEQSAQIDIEQSEQPGAVETVVVWNGNGARARWADKGELREVHKATDPDVLCFLEGKTDVENLVKLPLFREWATKSGLRQINCHWSTKDGKKGFGNEGIILFSKVPCKVKYGLGDRELDAQARVMTAEFPDCIMLFTYNPQGGFSEQSLAYRAKWEAALLKHIQSVSIEAMFAQKKMIWGGDLNVNPTSQDWSMRAFDRIRNRIPKGTLPAGCREEDQKAYRELVHRMDGVNVAERFGKQDFRTCFPSEDYLKKNFGQRIDHIIAHDSLLKEESELRITAFDTLIQFGASRKGSSDHCPLWFKLSRGHDQPALAAREQKEPEALLDPDMLMEFPKMLLILQSPNSRCLKIWSLLLSLLQLQASINLRTNGKSSLVRLYPTCTQTHLAWRSALTRMTRRRKSQCATHRRTTRSKTAPRLSSTVRFVAQTLLRVSQRKF